MHTHTCRHTRKIKSWQWTNCGMGTCGREQKGGRRKGCRGVRRRKEYLWVVLATAVPPPGRKQKSSPVEEKEAPLFLDKEGRDETSPKLRQTHQEGKSTFLLETHPDNHQIQPPCLSYRQTPKPTMSHRHSGFQVILLSLGTRCGGACQPHRWVGQLIISSLETDQKPRLAGKKGEASKVTSVMADTLLPLGLLRKGNKFPWDCQLPLAHRGWSR